MTNSENRQVMAEKVADCSPMDADTLEALRGSIAKWQAIVDGTGQDEGSFNCPLCHRFAHDRREPEQCMGCPVKEATGFKHCGGSPYDQYRLAEEDFNEEQITIEAKRELDFLISLLPPGECP